MSESSNRKSYKGSCHCGQVLYSASLPPLEEQDIVQCNCSMCQINGSLFVNSTTSEVQLEHNDDAVTEYAFASKKYPHYFCNKCGTSMYAKCAVPENSHVMALNVRTIQDIDIKGLKLKHLDGRIV